MHRSKPVLALLAAAALAVAAGRSHAQTYSYTTISDPLGTNGTYVSGISGNNLIGSYYDSSFGTNGFIYNLSTATYKTINDPSGDQINGGTSPSSIDGNNIVGSYTDDSEATHGFLYNGSTFKTIDDPLAVTNGPGPPGTVNGERVAVISGNYVDGQYSNAAGGIEGFLYNISNSSYTTISDPLAGPNGTNLGAISGNYIVGSYAGTTGPTNGLLYNISTSSYTTLDAPLGVNGTVPFNISGNYVVGEYADASQTLHGFIYNIATSSWTTLTDPLATMGSYFGSAASDIYGNYVLGTYQDSSLVNHGFLYNLTTQTYTTLNEPLANHLADNGTFYGRFYGNGNIFGDYYTDKDYGFVAVLTPEPSSVVLLGLGAVGLGAMAVRRRTRRQAASKRVGAVARHPRLATRRWDMSGKILARPHFLRALARFKHVNIKRAANTSSGPATLRVMQDRAGNN